MIQNFHRSQKHQIQLELLLLFVTPLAIGVVIWILLNIRGTLAGPWPIAVAAISTFFSIVVTLCQWLFPISSNVSSDAKVTDITMGTLIIETKEELRGQCVKLCCGFANSSVALSLPVDFASNVVKQVINGEVSFSATFPSLEPGQYTISVFNGSQMRYALVTVSPGRITRIDWQ